MYWNVNRTIRIEQVMISLNKVLLNAFNLFLNNALLTYFKLFLKN